MPTSVIGIRFARERAARGIRFARERAAGFTLIELMVVILVIGLASSIVVLAGLGGGPTPRAEAEALASRLVAARDRAVVAGSATAFVLDDGGYHFEVRSSGGWQQSGGRSSDAMAARRWPPGMAVAAEIEGGGRLSFDATGLATPALISLGAPGKQQAAVRVGAAGEVRIDAG